MSASVTLVSLNIERYKHLDTVRDFLAARTPEVACLQEVFEHDVERFARILGSASYAFEPMGRRPDEPPPGIMGIAIFSRYPIRHSESHYYVGQAGTLRDSSMEDVSSYNRVNRMTLVVDIEKDASVFRIATTHFTWTPDGEPDAAQRQDIKGLLSGIEDMGELVLCGDFNAPRGGEIFAALSSRYKDNVPDHYISSLDQELHRVKGLELMVDGIFSTPQYTVSDVKMVSGVSDHQALVAAVSKKG